MFHYGKINFLVYDYCILMYTLANKFTVCLMHFVPTIGKEEVKPWSEPNFSSECFYLTLHCHHLSIIPIMRKYQRRIRAIRDLSRMIEEMEGSHPQWKSQVQVRWNRSFLYIQKNAYKQIPCTHRKKEDKNMWTMQKRKWMIIKKGSLQNPTPLDFHKSVTSV